MRDLSLDGKVIGISGFAGSGKDTVGDFLEDKGFTKIALADPIKRAAMDWFDLSEEQLWGPSHLRNEPDLRYPINDERLIYNLDVKNTLFYNQSTVVDYLTPRIILQTLGTEVGRQIRKTVWIDYTFRIVKKLIDNPMMSYSRTKGLQKYLFKTPRKGVVITDIRFENEMKAFKDAGVFVIKVEREGAKLSGAAGEHSSEAEMLTLGGENFNKIIYNNKSLDDLKKSIDEAVLSFFP